MYSGNNNFKCYQTEGSITAEQVVKYVDDFSKTIKTPTVMIMDNATVHKSKIIQEKIKWWVELVLTICYLPAYSPHQNLIETLWRKIKHEWLKPYDFADKETFRNAIEDILENVGNVYKVSFKKEHLYRFTYLFFAKKVYLIRINE